MRGLLIGLTRGVNKAHICRAALEAIAFQVKDIIHCMEEDAHQCSLCMKVDGGASVSEILMQFRRYARLKVLRPKNTETTQPSGRLILQVLRWVFGRMKRSFFYLAKG